MTISVLSFYKRRRENACVGKTGRYETTLSEAMTFTEKYDAIVYIEKHGYERIATIRRVKISDKKVEN